MDYKPHLDMTSCRGALNEAKKADLRKNHFEIGMAGQNNFPFQSSHRA